MNRKTYFKKWYEQKKKDKNWVKRKNKKSRDYYTTHKEELKETRKIYFEKNKEKILKKRRIYLLENKERDSTKA